MDAPAKFKTELSLHTHCTYHTDETVHLGGRSAVWSNKNWMPILYLQKLTLHSKRPDIRGPDIQTIYSQNYSTSLFPLWDALLYRTNTPSFVGVHRRRSTQEPQSGSGQRIQWRHWSIWWLRASGEKTTAEFEKYFSIVMSAVAYAMFEEGMRVKEWKNNLA